ncbi:hypothetical protein JOM56_005707 [Amanita muscaria]
MSSFLKEKFKKPKAKTGQETGIELPSIRVEETPPELPLEGSFRRKAKEKIKNIFSPRPSHSRAPSQAPSERGKGQEYLPVLESTSKPDIEDRDRSVENKNDLDESLKPDDQQMGSRASEEAKGVTEDTSVNHPTKLISSLFKTPFRHPTANFKLCIRSVETCRTLQIMALNRPPSWTRPT